MQQLTPMFGSGVKYHLPADKVEDFKNDFGEEAEAGQSFRTKDGQGYTIPSSQVDAFKQDFPDAEPTRRMSFATADGKGMTKDMTVSELSKLYDGDYATNPIYKADIEATDKANAAKRAQDERDAIANEALEVKRKQDEAAARINAIPVGRIGDSLAEEAHQNLSDAGGTALGRAGLGIVEKSLRFLGMAFADIATFATGKAYSERDTPLQGAADKVRGAKDILYPEGPQGESALAQGIGKVNELGVGLAEFALTPTWLLAGGSFADGWTQTYDEAIRNGADAQTAGNIANARGAIDASVSVAFKKMPTNRLLKGLGVEFGSPAAKAAGQAVENVFKTKGAATAGVAKEMLFHAAKSAAEMGVLTDFQGIYDDAIMQMAEKGTDDPSVVDWAGAADRALPDAGKQAALGAVMALLPTPLKVAQARKAVDAQQKASLKTKAGRSAFAEMNPDAADTLVRSLEKEGKVSRKAAREAGLPDMPEAERNAIAAEYADARKSGRQAPMETTDPLKYESGKLEAKNERKAVEDRMAKKESAAKERDAQIAEEEAAAVAEENRGKKMAEEKARLDAEEQAKYDAEMEAREEGRYQSGKAESDAKAEAEKASKAEASEKARVETERAKTKAAQEAKARNKAEMAEYEKAEAERKAREAAEEAAVPEVGEEQARLEAEQKASREAVAEEAGKEVSRTDANPEYGEWLKKKGRKDTDKNWRKFVAENVADADTSAKPVEKPVEPRPVEKAPETPVKKPAEPNTINDTPEAPKAVKPVSASPAKEVVSKTETTTPQAKETPEQFRERVKADPVLKRIDAEMKKAKTDVERNALKDQFSKRLDDLRLAEKVDADRMEKLSTSKEVLEFAKKSGRAVVDGKVSPGTVNDYLRDQVKKAKDATKRLFRDAKVEVKDREYDKELDEGMVKLKSVKLSSSGIDVRDASAAIENQKGVIKNRITGIDAVLSSNGAGKLVSNSAVSKSVANGFTKRQHNEMASRIKELFEEAALIESRPDKNGDVNVKSIKRFVTPVELDGLKGDTACAYITVKESTEHGHRIYSIEEIKLTALPEKVRRVISDRNSAGNAVTEYSIAKGSFGVNSTLTLRSSNGRVVGTFDPTTKKVTLYRGADEKTVYHELIGHGVEDWARRNNKPLHDKLMRLANEAPESIRKEIEKKYPGADAATVAKEIVAKFAELKGGKNIELKDAPKNWIAKTYVAVRDAIIGFIEKIGGNRIDLGKIERMSPVEVMDYLTKEIGKGKTLGEIGSGKNGGKMGVGEKWANAIFDRHTSLYKESKEAGDAKSLQPGREAEFQVLKFNPKKDGYAKLLKEGDVAHEEVAEYMKAVAAKERNAADGWESSGLSDERIAQTIRHFENHPRAKEIKKAADFIWKMQDEGMRERIRAGLVSESEYKEWKEREEHHVPFRSAVDENGDFVAWNSGRGIAKGEFEQHDGRFTESGDPIAWMFEEYADAHLRAIENDTRVVLARAVEANPSLGKISTDPSLKELRVKGGEGSPNVVKFKEVGKNGKSVVKSIVLNGERGAAAASSYTNRDLKTMWSPLRRFMRFWSSTATEWSPTFGLRNTIKDNTDLALLALSEKGVKEGSKWIKEYSRVRTATAKEVWEYARTGKVKPGSAVDRYIKAGGLIGGFEREGYGDIKEQFSYDRIRKEMSGGANRYKSLGENTVGVIKAFNSWAELGTRIAAFEVNVKDGMSPKDAALWSRRATVDFNRKGNLTPITNTLFMFSNSVLGAKVRQLEAVKTGMKTSAGRRAIGAILLAGVGEAIAEHFMNQDDDERGKRGEATGKDITEFSRKNNFYLRFGGRMVNLGVHDDVLAQIKYYGNAVTRLALGDIDAKTVGKEVFGDAVANAASFSGLGAPSVEAGISGFFPTVLQPVAQDLSNKNYMGSPIRRQKYNDAQPDSSNGRKSTGATYKWIAESINELTGGNKGRAGAVDIAPETIKHYWESTFKNVGKDAENLVLAVSRALTGEYGQKDTNQTPGLRDVTRYYDSNDNRYFDNVRKYKEDEMELQKMKSTWTPSERKDYMDKHPWLRRNGTSSTRVKQLQTTINELRRKEGGEVKLQGGSWVAKEWPKEKVEEFAKRRAELQAKVIELMSR